MGIPAYFSHIIKNHPKIIENIDTFSIIHNLFLDCNSVIYDVVHEGNAKDENEIIQQVCHKIDSYIQLIKPANIVYVAFDGVAPVAKLQQQRERRLRSWLLNTLHNDIENKDASTWDTTAITPGTQFMDKLGKGVNTFFSNRCMSPRIIVSASDEPGEGEHKLFEYVRANLSSTDEISVVYGLDADLIMLSIHHLQICNNIFLYRESPHFIRNLNSKLDPNKSYILNIPLLSQEIVFELTNSSVYDKRRVCDYILLCFFLGNDFMPHFPCLNIRNNGVDTLMNTYKELVLEIDDFFLTNDDTIIWKNLKRFVKSLSQKQHELMIIEHNKRNKYEKRHYSTNTIEDKMNKLTNTPSIERSKEHYINPYEEEWESRFYDILFHIKVDDTRKKQICINYIEALEWTYKYYSKGCIHWRWKYNYHYAPLLSDLEKYIPFFQTSFFEEEHKSIKPVSPLTQLVYVMPRNNLHHIPSKTKELLLTQHSDWYPVDFSMEWSYCKYLWESHLIIPQINIDSIEKIIQK